MDRLQSFLFTADTAVRRGVKRFLQDCSGSDATEKIGSILVAAIIIGILIAAVKGPMKTMFESLMQKAQDLITQDASLAS